MGVQQKLSGDTIAELNYVGSSSANLSYYKDINQLPSGTLQTHPGVAANALRPYLGYQDIFQSTNGAISNYHSLQARLQKRIHGGGMLNMSYTWSKALTDASTYNYNPQDSLNLRGDYGPYEYNQPQILVISYVYPLHFWQNSAEWYKKALGKWQISGITRIASGLPINGPKNNGIRFESSLLNQFAASSWKLLLSGTNLLLKLNMMMLSKFILLSLAVAM